MAVLVGCKQRAAEPAPVAKVEAVRDAGVDAAAAKPAEAKPAPAKDGLAFDPSDADDPAPRLIRPIVDQQFDLLYDADDAPKSFLPDAPLIHTSGVGTPADRTFRVAEHAEQYMGHADRDTAIALSRDGQTAWASLTTRLTVLPQNQPGRDDPWRASDVLVQTPAGWRIAAALWSEPRANAVTNRDAKAGTLPALPALEGPSDPELAAALDALVTTGATSVAPDLVAIGSGPGERTVGGAAFAAAWNAGWKGRVEVASRLARRAPSGTTGWVVANVWLAKPGYRIPFQLLCIFDRAADGKTWTLVHVHFAV